MANEIVLPTLKEIDRALQGYGSTDGPQPLADIIDRHQELTMFVDLIVRRIETGMIPHKDAAKALLLFGLNIGIRIGEVRK